MVHTVWWPSGGPTGLACENSCRMMETGTVNAFHDFADVAYKALASAML